MTDIAIIDQPRNVERITRSSPHRVTGRLKTAIELMVWDGHHRDVAAEQAGLARKSLYNAFRKHHVKAFYRSELEVLRTSERARNIHTLTEVRDQKTNHMARVNAVKALEQISDEPGANADALRIPGVVINIVQIQHEQGKEAKPLIVQGDVSDAE